MSGDHNMHQKLSTADYHAWLDSPLTKTLKQSHKDQLRSLRMRIINMLEIQHEAAKDTHNHWLVAANLIRAEFKEPK
jgi:hypothetical protein